MGHAEKRDNARRCPTVPWIPDPPVFLYESVLMNPEHEGRPVFHISRSPMSFSSHFS